MENDFRQMATEMSRQGDKMNHSTARNVFLRAMRQMAGQVLVKMCGYAEERQVDKMARSHTFQTAVKEVLQYQHAVKRRDV